MKLKTYFSIVITLVLFSAIYGLIVPVLISMKDTGSVITGLALALLTPPCLYAIYKGFSTTKGKA